MSGRTPVPARVERLSANLTAAAEEVLRRGAIGVAAKIVLPSESSHNPKNDGATSVLLPVAP